MGPTEVVTRTPGWIGTQSLGCYNLCMESKDKDKDGGNQSKDEESSSTEHSSDDEGEIQAVKSEHGEPADNLKRRSDWFQKRHGSG